MTNFKYMKILIPIKRVNDYNVKVRPNQANTDVDLTNVKMAINPFCEIAVEEAIRLKEAGKAETEYIVKASFCCDQITQIVLHKKSKLHTFYLRTGRRGK